MRLVRAPRRDRGWEAQNENTVWRSGCRRRTRCWRASSTALAMLTADRERCQTLLQRLNAAPVAQERERWQILKELFKHLPDGPALGADPAGSVAPHIEPTFRCDYGYNITVGKNFNANFDCCILDCATVTIGDDVFFGPRVQIYTAGHPVVPRIRGNFRSGLEFAKPITIGHRWDGFVCMRSIR